MKKKKFQLRIQALINEFERTVALTDQFSDREITPIIFGLFGEVGSVISAAKKLSREKFESIYRREVVEELGDTLWYLAALCKRLKIDLAGLVFQVLEGNEDAASTIDGAESNSEDVAELSDGVIEKRDAILLSLGQHSALLCSLNLDAAQAKPMLMGFVRVYFETLQVVGASLADVCTGNINKVHSRFVRLPNADLPNFDANYSKEEQIPQEFEIEILQQSDGRVTSRWNGNNIGNFLTDNNKEPDGYRYHDVFHYANAAVLHWSPMFRKMIKHKRKSKVEIDETEDSGRAIIIEESISAYIFAHAKSLGFFENYQRVSFSLLKVIQQLVRGYEVANCPLSLWEDCILQSYDVFRQVLGNKGGIVIGNRNERKIRYKNIKR